MSKRVVVALSGGVDSAVSALLLKNAGWQVSAVFMRNWDSEDPECTAREDFFDALAVTEHIGIPLNAVDLSEAYRERVFDLFLQQQLQGLTPNPDVLCNTEIKFDALMEQALGDNQADYLATGHYARFEQNHLLRGVDDNKDQTYFMYQVSEQSLQRVLFPIGHLKKPEVRKIAEEAGLPVAKKRDSTGLCFVGERNFRQFLQQHIQASCGPITTPEGECIGEHIGLPYYTLGQRKGLGIGGMVKSNGQPWYAAEKQAHNNTLIAVQGAQHPLLLARKALTQPAHWINAAPPSARFECIARIRHRQTPQPCQVVVNDDGGTSVCFDTPQWAITPGQSVVFYDNDRCLGGAVICARETLQSL